MPKGAAAQRKKTDDLGGATVPKGAATPYDEENELQGGHIFAATINSIEENDGRILMLTDNCADEHVCGVDDFSWVKLT